MAKKKPIAVEGYNKPRSVLRPAGTFDLTVKKRPLREKADPRIEIPRSMDIEIDEGRTDKIVVNSERISEREEFAREGEGLNPFKTRDIQLYKTKVAEIRPKLVIDDGGEPIDVSEFASTPLDIPEEWHVIDLITPLPEGWKIAGVPTTEEELENALEQAKADKKNTEIAQEILKDEEDITVPSVFHFVDREGNYVRRIRRHAGDVQLTDVALSLNPQIVAEDGSGHEVYRPWLWKQLTKEFSREDVEKGLEILKKGIKKLHEAGYAHNNLLQNVLLSKKEGKVHVSIIDWDMMDKKGFEEDKEHLETLEHSLKAFDEIPKLQKKLRTNRYDKRK